MQKRLLLLAGLMLGIGMLGGCRFVAPVMEDIGGCPTACHMGGCDTKTKAMFRQWGRDARKGEEFIDTYFFNYSRCDPYRGDCYVGY